MKLVIKIAAGITLAVVLASAGAILVAPTAQAAPNDVIDTCIDDGYVQGRNGEVRLPHGPGWPCARFMHRARVIQRVRQLLIYNGYRPAMTVYVPSSRKGTGSARQITIRGIQDGVVMAVTVVKTGTRQIVVDAWSWELRDGSRLRVNLGFTA